MKEYSSLCPYASTISWKLLITSLAALFMRFMARLSLGFAKLYFLQSFEKPRPSIRTTIQFERGSVSSDSKFLT